MTQAQISILSENVALEKIVVVFLVNSSRWAIYNQSVTVGLSASPAIWGVSIHPSGFSNMSARYEGMEWSSSAICSIVEKKPAALGSCSACALPWYK